MFGTLSVQILSPNISLLVDSRKHFPDFVRIMCSDLFIFFKAKFSNYEMIIILTDPETLFYMQITIKLLC